jgi:dimethylhistidine N-methyltransferase
MISFSEDIRAGLSSSPKHISSKWFYNAQGDALFQQIMELPEYYLTRAEHQLLSQHKAAIFSEFDPNEAIQLIELGAGDGKKTCILIDYLTKTGRTFRYVPIDISQNVLDILCAALSQEYPGIEVLPITKDYFSALKDPLLQRGGKKLLLFLGSNVGNLDEQDSIDFFKELGASLHQGDAILTGFDRVKDPAKILAAYNDSQGVTRDFNLNLLRRMNDELGADFDINLWEHVPEYSIEQKSALSFLKSKTAQVVHFNSLNMRVSFQENELIHTEISRKFDLEDIALLAKAAGFNKIRNFDHPEPLYTDSLWSIKAS